MFPPFFRLSIHGVLCGSEMLNFNATVVSRKLNMSQEQFKMLKMKQYLFTFKKSKNK